MKPVVGAIDAEEAAEPRSRVNRGEIHESKILVDPQITGDQQPLREEHAELHQESRADAVDRVVDAVIRHAAPTLHEQLDDDQHEKSGTRQCDVVRNHRSQASGRKGVWRIGALGADSNSPTQLT